MGKSSNINLYSDKNGSNKFQLKVSENGVSVSSVKPINFPDVNIGKTVGVDVTITKLRSDLNNEISNRNKSVETLVKNIVSKDVESRNLSIDKNNISIEQLKKAVNDMSNKIIRLENELKTTKENLQDLTSN